MIREYRFSKTAKILTFIIAPLLIAACFYGGFIAEIKASNTIRIIIAAVASSFIFCVIMSIIEVIKTKLIIEDDCFIKTRIFSTRTLAFKEIEGFREDDNHIYIISKVPNKKNIKITTYFNNSNYLSNFLQKKFPDLDRNDLRKKENKFYRNKKKEITKKKEKIEKAILPLNWIGIASTLMFYFIPLNYEFLTIINILIPTIGLIILVKNKGFVSIMPYNDSLYPTLKYVLYWPVGALIVGIIMNYEILSYSNIWIPTTLITFIIVYIIKHYRDGESLQETKNEKRIIYIVTTAYVSVFVFISLLHLNCTFDYKEGEVFKTDVISKEIKEDSDHDLTYFITVHDWTNKTGMNEFKISKERYKKLDINNRVYIIVKDGLLGIPWYYLDK
ncbi:MAG: hypothetical protein WBG43_02655 [Marinifilaceae bacterium]